MIYIVKWMLLLLWLFFSSMALWGFSATYEEFKKRNKKWYKSDYKMKLLFTILVLIFWIVFIYNWFTIEI